MKLATVYHGGGTRAARVDLNDVILLPHDDVGELLRSPDWPSTARLDGEALSLADVALGPVITNPARIVCVGLNYAGHIREMGREFPVHPTLFSKFASALTGPVDPVELPAASSKVDWEAELAVVIGAPGRNIAVEDALAHVAGYTVLNDVSMRDWQNRTTQWLAGKSWDRSTPIGPWLVTADDLPPGGAGLRISCSIDGRLVQDDNTADLLFDVAHLVSDVSVMTRLEPGDIIATGTPNGVGAGRTPPEFLEPGQTMVTTIEGIGSLANPIVTPQ